MAYAAVISLKQTIHHLLNSSHISLASSSREILEFAYNEANSLKQVLKRLDDSGSSSSKRLNALDGEIRDAVRKLEDLLESHESNHELLSQSESLGDEGSSHNLSPDLEKVIGKEINSFAETMKKMEEVYIKELDNPSPEEEEEDDDAAAVSSTSVDFGGKNMVGLSDEFTDIIMDLLFQGWRPLDFCVFLVVGRAGTGRTVAAKALFEDLCIGQKAYFDCGAWVSIGPKYQFKEILRNILAQIDVAASNDELLVSEGDEKLAEYLHATLKGRRYMIVLDDIRDTEVWDYLRRSFPEQNNGSLVLLTTSLMDGGGFANVGPYIYEMPNYDEEVSWHMLWATTINDRSSDPEFEQVGKKIARNCQGLYIAVAKVILFLRKAEKTLEYWKEVAADQENSIFMVADEISEVYKIKEDMELCNSDDDNERNLVSTQVVIKNLLSLSNMIKVLIKTKLFPERFFPCMKIVSFCGMAGIGKTAFVEKIFEDPVILHYFDHHVWVTLGQKYQSEEILVDILAQIYPDIDKIKIKGDVKLAEDLCAQLSYKRCLIVLDDVWNMEPLHYLKKLFPNIKGKALVTTRLEKVAQFGKCDRVLKMRLLNEEESWCLFCQKVFAKGSCPPELEKAGKKISKNCDGLPLLILTVADLLSKVEKIPMYWNNVAEKPNSFLMNAHSQLSKVLLPSYKILPQHIKACFLYMGVFNQNFEIHTSKLINLWIAEGFLEPNPSQNVEDFAMECLLELFWNNLIIVCEESSNFKIKTCRLHSVFWHLSNTEAVKDKFFHALETYADNSVKGIKSQCRLCIRNSILLGIKDVSNSMASVSSVRSLLCTGPLHQYQVPIYLDLRLLRVLDALSIRFYKFPIEVVRLVLLKYLALTYNGNLPASMSKLRNLQYLIVSQYLSIIFSKDSLYLPVEIWDMKELRHLQVMGSILPEPYEGALLPKLLTLLDVSAYSCSPKVLQKIPNLKRLGIRIELAHYVGQSLQRCLNHISCLPALESLKCILVCPEIMPKFVPPIPISMFPSTLKKLSLSGLGYPWEYMLIIDELQNLEVLKLRCYAFRGPKWQTGHSMFKKVKFLLIEDTDLVSWEMKMPGFLMLKCLSIKHCYKLEEVPSQFFKSVETFEIVDCPLAVKDKDLKNSRRLKTIKVHSSWDAGNLKQ